MSFMASIKTIGIYWIELLSLSLSMASMVFWPGNYAIMLTHFLLNFGGCLVLFLSFVSFGPILNYKVLATPLILIMLRIINLP